MSTVPHYRRKEAIHPQSRTTDIRSNKLLYYVDSRTPYVVQGRSRAHLASQSLKQT